MTGLPSIENTNPRAEIELIDGKIVRNRSSCPVQLSKTGIRVGCSDITIEAAKHLVNKWEEHFGTGERIVTLQQ